MTGRLRRSGALDHLSAASRQVAGILEPAKLAEIALREAMALAGATGGAVFLPLPASGCWECVADQGLSPEQIDRAEAFLSEGEAQDMSAFWRELGWAGSHQAVLGAIARPAGLLVLLAEEWTGDPELIAHFAPVVSSALQGALQHAQSQGTLARLYTLHEFSKAISTSLEADQVASCAVDAILGTIGASGVALLLGEGAELVLVEQRGLGVSSEVRIPLGEGLLARVATGRIPLRKDALSPTERQQLLRGVDLTRVQSVMAVPVHCGEEVSGVLLAVQEHRDVFSEDQLKLMTVIASLAGTALANAASHGKAQRLLGFFYNLHELSKFIGASLALDQVADFVCDALTGMTGASHVGLFLAAGMTGFPDVPQDDPGLYVLSATRGFSLPRVPVLVRSGEGPVGRAIAQRQPLLAEGDDLLAQTTGMPQTRVKSLLIAPMALRTGVVGALVVGQTQGGAFGETQRQMLAITATQVATAVNNAQLFGRVSQLASTDGLTGLYNHRFFQDALRRALETYHRYGRNFSLILADLDHFKRINDTHGHQAGDQVLVEVGRRIGRTIRSSDIAARYGGEELAIILPETDHDGALNLAERIREAIAASPIHIEPDCDLQVTISLGLATCTRHGTTPQALIEHADRGLYRAKATGRNRVGN